MKQEFRGPVVWQGHFDLGLKPVSLRIEPDLQGLVEDFSIEQRAAKHEQKRHNATEEEFVGHNAHWIPDLADDTGRLFLYRLEGQVLLRLGSLLLLTGMMTWAHATEKAVNAVVDLSALMDMDGLIEQVADRRVVYVGESHDQYQHHLNQLSVIKGMHARHKHLAIGLEFFFQPFQDALDRYIAGEIDEPALLRETEYFERWRFDYRLYRPIFRYAREHGIPLVALNLEREITDQVAREGMQSLSEDQRQRLPRDIERDNPAYVDRIRSVFDHHPPREGRTFEHFLQVQLLWDESMAERVAGWLERNPDGRMVVLAGGGHLIYRQGIPDRVERRLSVNSAVILNVNQAGELDQDVADYLVVAPRNELPPAGKLGVFLDLKASPPEVSGFDETSGAAKAGVKSGDKVIAIDGTPINSYSDIRIALMDKTVGDTVTVEVERERVLLDTLRKTFTVTLN